MGTQFTHNDSLQITREQGFPEELVYAKHLKKNFTAKDFANKIFAFHDKQGLRFYQAPPTRNFLIENANGKWLYWGLVHILELHLDYEHKVASGKFSIIYINTPEEMKNVFRLVDGRPEYDFF